MAVYTKLSIENVQEIMSRYGVTNVSKISELSGGSQNSNYQIKCSDNDYVVSICEQNSTKEAINLTLLLEHLAAYNYSTSILIRTIDKQAISYWEGKPLIVKRYIKGIVEEDIPVHLVKLIGTALGKLHKIPSPDFIPDTISYGIEYFHQVEQYAADTEYHTWIKEKQAFIESYITEKLPKTLIHSDVFSSNVIIDNSEEFVTIMDFEEATNYYRVFDVGMTIIGICKEGKGINFDKTKSLLNGYSQEIQLTKVEVESLQAFVVYAATAMSFWRHKNFNYTIPTPSLCNHYLELKIVADTIHDMSSKNFIHQLEL